MQQDLRSQKNPSRQRHVQKREIMKERPLLKLPDCETAAEKQLNSTIQGSIRSIFVAHTSGIRLQV